MSDFDFDFSGIEKIVDFILGDEPILEAHAEALCEALDQLPDAALAGALTRLTTCFKGTDETYLRSRGRLTQLNQMARASPLLFKALERHRIACGAERDRQALLEKSEKAAREAAWQAAQQSAQQSFHAAKTAMANARTSATPVQSHLVKVVDVQGRQQLFSVDHDPYVALAQYVVQGYATKDAAKAAQICPIEGLRPIDKGHLAEVLAWEHLVAQSIEFGLGWVRENFLEKDPDKCERLMAEVRMRTARPAQDDETEAAEGYGG